ncbi:MAG: hypothetical protein PVG33_02750 [Chloroflexota bacterium]
MYPEDRVLIAYMPEPADFIRARDEGWYRVPQRHAPKGLYAEYFAFYFGREFGDQKWAIHHFARQTGFELLRRVDLLPEEADHPRAEALYYRVALGPMQTLEQPIVSLRWRRISFMHTTWDRFVEAREINDLLLNGGEYVDRLYATLKERGIAAKRNYEVKEPGGSYRVPLAVLSDAGLMEFYEGDAPASDAGRERLADKIERGMARST